MPLISSQTTVIENIREDKELAIALFREAIDALFSGNAAESRLLLRDIVNGTIGFEPLAVATGIPVKSLHRMLSAKGNPSMGNLSRIIQVLRETLKIEFALEVKQAELV